MRKLQLLLLLDAAPVPEDPSEVPLPVDPVGQPVEAEAPLLVVLVFVPLEATGIDVSRVSK